MSQRIDKIEQELVKLESAIALMSQQILTAYSSYLKLLGKTVQRQLVMAVYQICTDSYAEAFLQLSLNQRINLQTKVRQIAQGIMMQLLTPLADLEKIISPPQLLDRAPQLVTPIVTQITPQIAPQITNIDANTNMNLVTINDVQTSDQTNNQATNSLKTKEVKKVAKIRELVNWQQQTEAEISQLLQQGSKEVNNLLHQAGLLAQKLPIALLETATKVESLNRAAVAGKPNTINLLMEMENSETNDEDTPPQEPLHLTAIYLQMGDLEFNDPELAKVSNSMRSVIVKLHALDREYHKQLKAYQVAQAQAAWRSSWVDD